MLGCADWEVPLTTCHASVPGTPVKPAPLPVKVPVMLPPFVTTPDGSRASGTVPVSWPAGRLVKPAPLPVKVAARTLPAKMAPPSAQNLILRSMKLVPAPTMSNAPGVKAS